MDVYCNPRGDLPSMMIQPIHYLPRPLSNLVEYESKRSSLNTLQKPKRKQCYDWIFSSSSNVHVAIDRSCFKRYHPLDSFVLALSDHRRIMVRGIGAVELKIRCKPGAKGDRTILLEDVLHIPHWLCNIFSDVYFHRLPGFDFAWNDFGVSFVVQEKEKIRPWGFTESFCGLDRLVLARRHEGRSPMLEDKEREIFAINVTWPQSQRDRWDRYIANCNRQSVKDIIANTMIREREREQSTKAKHNRSPRSESRIKMNEINSNIAMVKKDLGRRTTSLRATISTMGLFQMAKSMSFKNT